MRAVAQSSGMRSVRETRTIIGIVIILIALVVFGWLSWMVGQAGYNQTDPNTGIGNQKRALPSKATASQRRLLACSFASAHLQFSGV